MSTIDLPKSQDVYNSIVFPIVYLNGQPLFIFIQRSLNDDQFAGRLGPITETYDGGGSIEMAPELYEDTAHQGMNQELGLDQEDYDLSAIPAAPVLSHRNLENGNMHNYKLYTATLGRDSFGKIRINKEEIQGIKMFSTSELLNAIKTRPDIFMDARELNFVVSKFILPFLES